jgi:phospholipid/cholesterol/gamma-HCH transport system substrate-binding protein
MFDVQPGQHKPKLVRNGAIFAALVSIFLWILYTKPSIPFFTSAGTTIKADFAYAADLQPGYTPVRVLGVNVGVVSAVGRATSGRGVQVAMTIDPGKGVIVKQDASASLRWRTLLGLNYYVDLTPGSPSAPRLGGRVIPESRTSSQVELDQALEPLNAQGRQALQTTIDQFDAGFANPTAVGQTIQNFAPAMTNLAAGLPALRGTTPGDLPALVASTSKAMGALAGDEVALGGLIDSGAVALGVTAAQRIDLGSTFDQAPGALAQTQATMARLRVTLGILDPIARQLRPGARRLYRAATLAQTAVSAATPLLGDLKPTLAAIRPSVTALATAAKAGVPVIDSLTPTLDRITSSFLPFLGQTDPETKLKNYEAVGPAVAGVSSAIAYGDQYGTLADFEAGFGENTLGSISPCSTFLTDPTVPLQKKIDCQALSQLLVSILSGQSPTTPLARSVAPQNLVNSLLTSAKGAVKP